ncbi:MAG: phospholipase [Acidimicrobiia bacterium]|nr:phospholipase [Acidimicrobiia bacterium]
MRLATLAFVFALGSSGCGRLAQDTRVEARPATPTISVSPGAHRLGLGSLMLRDLSWRDGTLFVPRNAATRPSPLLVLLHGGGGRETDFHAVFRPLVDEFGVVAVTLDARHNTWDGIDSPYGPDVRSIDAALDHVFDRLVIDRSRIALGGLSDGGTYSLSLGLANGDLFTHLIAIAPGYYSPPSPPVGRPRIFVGHGVRDNVYNVRLSRYFTVPRLQGDGYDVTYFEFDGPHWVTEVAARRALEWLTEAPGPRS